MSGSNTTNSSIKRELNVPPPPPPARPAAPVIPTPPTISSPIIVQESLPRISQFHWETIDPQKFPNISLPWIYRDNEKYLSVRMIENTILSKFESLDTPEIKQHGELQSVLCSQAEYMLFNEINIHHCDQLFGTEHFNDKDGMVKLDDFKRFYEVLKSSCKTKDEAKLVHTNNGMMSQHQQHIRPNYSAQSVPTRILNPGQYRQDLSFRPLNSNLPEYMNSNPHYVDPNRLISHRVSPNQIYQRLPQPNINIPLNQQPNRNISPNYQNQMLSGQHINGNQQMVHPQHQQSMSHSLHSYMPSTATPIDQHNPNLYNNNNNNVLMNLQKRLHEVAYERNQIEAGNNNSNRQFQQPINQEHYNYSLTEMPVNNLPQFGQPQYPNNFNSFSNNFIAANPRGLLNNRTYTIKKFVFFNLFKLKYFCS